MLPIAPFDFVDYLETANSRLTEQFQDKKLVNKYLQIIIEQSVEIQDVLKTLKQDRLLDTATGKQLDILGDIVGQSRIVADANLIAYFGFKNTFLAESFGDLNNPSVGGIFLSLGESELGTRTLTDDAYRIFIKARIFKNNSTATPEEFLDMLRFVFNPDGVRLQETGNASIRVDFGGQIGTFEKIILKAAKEVGNILPIPLGVGFESAEYDPEDFFAFDGVPGARGFGSLIWSHTYAGNVLHDNSVQYDAERIMLVENVYTDTLDGSEFLEGGDTLTGGTFVETRTVGGKFSSII